METESTEEIMLEIKDTLVSLDRADRCFCGDVEKGLGQCCMAGGAGAPFTSEAPA